MGGIRGPLCGAWDGGPVVVKNFPNPTLTKRKMVTFEIDYVFLNSEGRALKFGKFHTRLKRTTYPHLCLQSENPTPETYPKSKT